MDDDDTYENQICHSMMGTFLIKSITPALCQRIQAKKDQWFYIEHNALNGLILFKILISYGSIGSHAGIDKNKSKLQHLKLVAYEHDMIKLMDDFEATLVQIQSKVSNLAIIHYASSRLLKPRMTQSSITTYRHLRTSGMMVKTSTGLSWQTRPFRGTRHYVRQAFGKVQMLKKNKSWCLPLQFSPWQKWLVILPIQRKLRMDLRMQWEVHPSMPHGNPSLPPPMNPTRCRRAPDPTIGASIMAPLACGLLTSLQMQRPSSRESKRGQWRWGEEWHEENCKAQPQTQCMVAWKQPLPPSTRPSPGLTSAAQMKGRIFREGWANGC